MLSFSLAIDYNGDTEPFDYSVVKCILEKLSRSLGKVFLVFGMKLKVFRDSAGQAVKNGDLEKL